MSKLMQRLIPFVLISFPLFTMQSMAEEANKNMVDMNSYLCKDIMRMSGEERSIALGVLHGYELGKKGVVSYDPNKLGKVTDEFIEYCLDHPDDKALVTFEKLAK